MKTPSGSVISAIYKPFSWQGTKLSKNLRAESLFLIIFHSYIVLLYIILKVLMSLSYFFAQASDGLLGSSPTPCNALYETNAMHQLQIELIRYLRTEN